MCLDRITRVVEPEEYDRKTKVKAWKIFGRNHRGRLVSFYRRQLVAVGRWEQASRDSLQLLGTKERYDSGYHAFTTKSDANLYVMFDCIPEDLAVIRQVELKGVRVYGRQIGLKCMVADFQRVLPLKKKGQQT